MNDTRYPPVFVKSNYGIYISIILNEYFQEDGIVESIIKDNNNNTIVNFNNNINNNNLEMFFNELKIKDIFLNYNNENIEFSLIKN
jgi:hypothetical protein